MPTYLLHGFRWHRQSIRIHVILNDLDDATPEWLLAPATSVSILNSLYSLYDFLPPSNPPAIKYTQIPTPPTTNEEDKPKQGKPETNKLKKSKSLISLRSRSISRKSRLPAELAPAVNASGNGTNGRTGSTTSGSDPRLSTTSESVNAQSSKPEKKISFNDWSVVKLVEQYDPSDMVSLSQPYAYVADYMVDVSLGVAVTEEMAKYEVKMKMDDGYMSPATPGTPGTPATLGRSSSMSMREMRRMERRSGWFEKLRDGLQTGEDIGWHVVVCGDEERLFPSMASVRERLEIDDDVLRTPRSAGFRGFFRKRNVHED
ncbi:hypothetical protein D0Z07_4451 [Hyphodiscus hymeniophilus]|uniref:Developmental regulator protein n=1 Tax=Hyphodiscus hymeniophilus TaxID=353542 RepID=A0A9P6VJ87_9HELO|nr:hypothetical protein D0Z07_4451 [Hyphodiscus hymeniophilus]